ncbi:MAG: NUDIX domain-containing protein [Acidobacteria bacterium]|nr:NUDIX domain-containing protein [Acidobacteriota bacterium]
MKDPLIRVVAALITDPRGHQLLVRKRGTDRFMQAGGKPEAGESPRGALVRELSEELGLEVAESALVPLGPYATDAANEPGHRLEAEVFSLPLPSGVADALEPHAEIEELRWCSPAEAAALGDRLAPLAHLLLAP